MGTPPIDHSTPSSLQDAGYQSEHDYDGGSPHLAHRELRERMITTIRDVVTERLSTTGRARVLEVGAGHGAFTDHVLAAGAQVTITEMSQASAELLMRRYEHNPSARVVFDQTGEGANIAGERFDIVLCMSVLHHIPDYLGAIRAWTRQLAPQGTFLSFQDPLFYPRRSRQNLAVDRGAYYVWRVVRGHDLVAGLKSFTRRARNAFDEDNYRDMVEYHVLRDGVDEEAIAAQLRQSFEAVETIRYWSTQSGALQRLGSHFGIESSFGVLATKMRDLPDE